MSKPGADDDIDDEEDEAGLSAALAAAGLAQPSDDHLELAAFLGDDLSRTRCAQAGRKVPEVDNQPAAWVAGLCKLAGRWPPELARQATGRVALAFARIAVQAAGERDRQLAGDVPKRLLTATQMALVGDRQVAHRSIAELLRPDLLSIPEPGRRLRAAALLAFQQALQGVTHPAGLTAIAETFMQTAGAEDRKAAWRGLKDELRSGIVPWALGRGDPLAR